MTAPLLFQPHGVKHLSPSQLDVFIWCPRRWWYQYVEKRPRKASGAMLTGNAAHHALAAYFRHKWKLKKQMEEAQLLTSFSQEFDKQAHKEPVEWGTDTRGEPLDEGKSKDRGVVALRAVVKTLLPKIDPMGVEVAVRRFIPGTDIVLVGYIDVLEADAIRDYKFSARAKTEKDAHHSNQLTAYAWMARHPYEKKEGTFDVSLEVATFAGKALRLASHRSRAHLEFYEHEILARVVRTMHHCLTSNNFPCLVEGWWCSEKHCDFWADCMGRARKGDATK